MGHFLLQTVTLPGLVMFDVVDVGFQWVSLASTTECGSDCGSDSPKLVGTGKDEFQKIGFSNIAALF